MKQIILLFACLFALQGLAKADDDRAITVDQLPQKAHEFIQKYFPKNEISLAKMEKTFGKRNMKLYLSTEKKLNFWKTAHGKKSTVNILQYRQESYLKPLKTT